jgi:hypothetical protein
MHLKRIAIPAILVAGLAALPLSAANAQYYPPCHPFPLFWPFCAAAAVVGTAGMIVTAPLRAVAAPPYYYGPPQARYYQPPPRYYPPPPAYYPPPYYYGPR